MDGGADQSLRNAVLAALDPALRAQLLVHAALEPIRTGDRLAADGSTLEAAWFPVEGAVAVLVALEDGSTMQSVLVGRGGAAGLESVLVGGSTPHGLVGILPGSAFRVPGEPLRRMVESDPSLCHAILREVALQAAALHVAVACGRHHRVARRCARWLLEVWDDAAIGADPASGQLAITEETLSLLLGTQRATIAVALGRLAAAGAIVHGRGVVGIADRTALERASCPCYRVLREARRPRA